MLQCGRGGKLDLGGLGLKAAEMPPPFALRMRVLIVAMALTATPAWVSAREVAVGREPDKVHLFAEGYLQGVGATDTTATRGADGVWRLSTVTGVPGNWSKPKTRRLSRREVNALEALLDDPSSYLNDPGPDPGGPCLDPWSMRIEWSRRSKGHVVEQQCGPWGVASRISQILWPPSP